MTKQPLPVLVYKRVFCRLKEGPLLVVDVQLLDSRTTTLLCADEQAVFGVSTTADARKSTTGNNW